MSQLALCSFPCLCLHQFPGPWKQFPASVSFQLSEFSGGEGEFDKATQTQQVSVRGPIQSRVGETNIAGLSPSPRLFFCTSSNLGMRFTFLGTLPRPQETQGCPIAHFHSNVHFFLQNLSIVDVFLSSQVSVRSKISYLQCLFSTYHSVWHRVGA